MLLQLQQLHLPASLLELDDDVLASVRSIGDVDPTKLFLLGHVVGEDPFLDQARLHDGAVRSALPTWIQ
ncbi:hypothetical protein D9M70_596400 [compost metagenome]